MFSYLRGKVTLEVLALYKETKPDIYPGAPISVDPFGSYTGRTKDEDLKPIQDADDL